jgi:hypothetical protein
MFVTYSSLEEISKNEYHSMSQTWAKIDSSLDILGARTSNQISIGRTPASRDQELKSKHYYMGSTNILRSTSTPPTTRTLWSQEQYALHGLE